jgi:hypothetical protein
VLHAIEAWTSFYVILGSSAGALTGLQFVVAALVADTHNSSGFSSTSSAFATPTVVHFSVVLVLSGIFAAPWAAAGVPMILIGSGGVAGALYSGIVGRRARRQKQYLPVLEDWLFHVCIPGTAYLTMAVAALVSRAHIEGALFAVGGSALLLLIVGIHNAWDTVTYIVATRTGPEQKIEPKHERGRRR